MAVIFKEDQLKSIIRIIEKFIKRVKWCTLEEKKKIFICVLERSDIDDSIKNLMIQNAVNSETEESFFRYLRNSKAYYENKQRALLRLQRQKARMREKRPVKY